MGLPLWLLERETRKDDEITDRIIAAATETDARNLAREKPGHEDPDVWTDPTKVPCIQIAPDSIYSAPGIILDQGTWV